MLLIAIILFDNSVGLLQIQQVPVIMVFAMYVEQEKPSDRVQRFDADVTSNSESSDSYYDNILDLAKVNRT